MNLANGERGIPMSSTNDRIKALELALNNESKEKDFYLSHAERTNDALGKEMFKTLAKDEEEHYNRILALHKKLEDEGKWPETLPLDVKGTVVIDVLNTVIEKVKTDTKADNDDLEAVKIAIEFETKGEAFYKGLKETVDNEQEKQFYGFLESIEREHRLSLEDTLAYFEDPVSWYQNMEKSGLDGA